MCMRTCQNKEMNNMTKQINNNTRTSGTDVTNLGDYSTMAVKTSDGKDINLRLYGR